MLLPLPLQPLRPTRSWFWTSGKMPLRTQIASAPICGRLGRCYPVMDKSIDEDCYRKAIQTYGLPEAVYCGDKKPLWFVDPEDLANAFLHCETRKVDKSGCISFMAGFKLMQLSVQRNKRTGAELNARSAFHWLQ